MHPKIYNIKKVILAGLLLAAWFGAAAQIAARYNSFAAAGINNAVVQGAFNLFPNPATSSVTVSSSEFADGFDMLVTDVTGKKVMVLPNQRTNQAISIARLESGLYLLQITDGKKTGVRKLVKE